MALAANLKICCVIALASFLIDSILIAVWPLLTTNALGFAAIAGRYLWVENLKPNLASGICMGQIWLLAMFAVLGSGNHVVRIVLGAIFILVAGLCLTTLANELGGRNSVEQIEPSPLLVFFYFLAQLPLWLMRWRAGWRLSGREASHHSFRFRTHHVLGWSAFFVFPLFIWKSLITSELQVVEPEWIMWGILFCFIFATGYLVMTHALGTRSAQSATCISTVTAALVSAMSSGLGHLLDGGRFFWQGLVVSFIGLMASAIVVFIGLQIYAALGLRFSTSATRIANELPADSV